jgi:hypothetical protein
MIFFGEKQPFSIGKIRKNSNLLTRTQSIWRKNEQAESTGTP